jgi:hypothetical protein
MYKDEQYSNRLDEKTIICKCCDSVIVDSPTADFMIHEVVGDNWRKECVCAKCVRDIGLFFIERLPTNYNNFG